MSGANLLCRRRLCAEDRGASFVVAEAGSEEPQRTQQAFRAVKGARRGPDLLFPCCVALEKPVNLSEPPCSL